MEVNGDGSHAEGDGSRVREIRPLSLETRPLSPETRPLSPETRPLPLENRPLPLNFVPDNLVCFKIKIEGFSVSFIDGRMLWFIGIIYNAVFSAFDISVYFYIVVR